MYSFDKGHGAYRDLGHEQAMSVWRAEGSDVLAISWLHSEAY